MTETANQRILNAIVDKLEDNDIKVEFNKEKSKISNSESFSLIKNVYDGSDAGKGLLEYAVGFNNEGEEKSLGSFKSDYLSLHDVVAFSGLYSNAKLNNKIFEKEVDLIMSNMSAVPNASKNKTKLILKVRHTPGHWTTQVDLPNGNTVILDSRGVGVEKNDSEIVVRTNTQVDYHCGLHAMHSLAAVAKLGDEYTKKLGENEKPNWDYFEDLIKGLKLENFSDDQLIEQRKKVCQLRILDILGDVRVNDENSIKKLINEEEINQKKQVIFEELESEMLGKVKFPEINVSTLDLSSNDVTKVEEVEVAEATRVAVEEVQRQAEADKAAKVEANEKIVKNILNLYTQENLNEEDIVEKVNQLEGNKEELGKLLNQVDWNGRTPLRIAISKGYLEVVKLLIEKGADVNQVNNKRTPLYAAISKGYLEVVKLLIEKGANVNQVDEYEHTPLYVAASMGHLEVVKLLIEKGADVNNEINDIKQTPLYIASLNNHLDVVKALIDSNKVSKQTLENVGKFVNNNKFVKKEVKNFINKEVAAKAAAKIAAEVAAKAAAKIAVAEAAAGVPTLLRSVQKFQASVPVPVKQNKVDELLKILKEEGKKVSSTPTGGFRISKGSSDNIKQHLADALNMINAGSSISVNFGAGKELNNKDYSPEDVKGACKAYNEYINEELKTKVIGDDKNLLNFTNLNDLTEENIDKLDGYLNPKGTKYAGLGFKGKISQDGNMYTIEVTEVPDSTFAKMLDLVVGDTITYNDSDRLGLVGVTEKIRDVDSYKNGLVTVKDSNNIDKELDFDKLKTKGINQTLSCDSEGELTPANYKDILGVEQKCLKSKSFSL